MAIAEKATGVKPVSRDELKAKVDRKDSLTDWLESPDVVEIR